MFDTARAIYRAYGVRGAARRLEHELRKRTGYKDAPTLPMPDAFERFLRVGGQSAQPSAAVRERGDHLRRGEFQAFGDQWRELPLGAWQTHPLSGVQYAALPWYRIRHVDPTVGDIKDAWEPARFGWTYDLIRSSAAFNHGSDIFWRVFQDFMESNPPFAGVQWSCGQETAMRATAWLWAESFWSWPNDVSPEVRARLALAIWHSGERIADAIGYGLSQRNNHALWESAALAAIGARFAGSPVADRWLRDGIQYFEQAVLDQFGEDGWYAQHSFTYTRVALQAAVLMQLVARAVNRPLSPEVTQRIKAANLLLYALHDERTGDVPNYGANDGANPMSFSSSDYRDFRPIISAVAIVFDQEIPAPFTPDRESEWWLGGAVRVAGERPALIRGDGWLSARAGNAQLFTRAGTYRARSGHLDPMHVELWNDGRPIAVDAGTYRYVAAPPFNDGLRATEVHNTIDIPALPIAHRGPGFLSIGAPTAEVVSSSAQAGEIDVRLRNHSWATHGIIHDRHITLSALECRVTDLVTGPPGVVASLQWLTPSADLAPRVQASVPLELTRVMGDESSIRGWRSLFYAAKAPACSVAHSFRIPAGGTVTIVSTFSLDSA